MNDLTPHAPSPAQEDPTIHRFLATLPTFGPLPGFEDRIMTHVRLPAPPWLQWLRRRGTSAGTRRTLRVLAGGMAVGSAASSVAVATLALTRPGLFEMIGRALVTQVGLPVWRVVVGYLSSIWSTLSTLVGTLAPPGALAAVTVAILTLCTWGLYRTMQPGLRARTSFDAHR